MRENTSELGIELRDTEWQRRRNDDGEHRVLTVAVPVINPQSDTRDSYVDGDVIVGEIPVTDADTPCSDDHLDAAAVTALEERVTAYYPHGDRIVTLIWEASTDEWRCDDQEAATGEFDVEGARRDPQETVVWSRER